MSQFKLFVWRDVLQDYINGMAVGFAETEEEARQAIIAEAIAKEGATGFSADILEFQLRQIKEDVARPPDKDRKSVV